MRRIVFLDIDGVLNSKRFHRERDEACPESESTYDLDWQLDCVAVARLNRLIAATEAKIVISSSWRTLLDPSELKRILVEHGLLAEIIGATPHKAPEMLARYGSFNVRGHEIDYWLRKHPDVDRFVILDDDADMDMHSNRLVQTDCAEGLLDEHVELAIRMMAVPFDALEGR